jgi:hypothetical protein
MLEDWILCSCDCNGNIYVKAQFAHYLATSAFYDHAKVFCQFAHLAAPPLFLIMPEPLVNMLISQLPDL